MEVLVLIIVTVSVIGGAVLACKWPRPLRWMK